MSIIKICNEEGIIIARNTVRDLAEKMGFSILNKTRIATAVNELARNTLSHGGGGKMDLEVVENNTKTGIKCVVVDSGCGIQDIEMAMTDGFSTNKGFGQGLPATKRLVDSFKIKSKAGKGTRVEIIKYGNR
ncbi:anti-sigma regulatory factor [candidate division KSB1 bacterium]